LEELFEEERIHPPQQQDEEISEKSCEIAQLPTAREDGLRVRNAAKNDWISRAGRQDRPFESGYRPRTSDSRASKTDLDATPMTWAKASRRLGYPRYAVHACPIIVPSVVGDLHHLRVGVAKGFELRRL
jgi:hypothetical protein